MRIIFFDKIAGIHEGTVKDLPSAIAQEMIEKGYAVIEGEEPTKTEPVKEKSIVKPKNKIAKR